MLPACKRGSAAFDSDHASLKKQGKIQFGLQPNWRAYHIGGRPTQNEITSCWGFENSFFNHRVLDRDDQLADDEKTATGLPKLPYRVSRNQLIFFRRVPRFT